ncbi:MAG: arginine--tRNA ligase [Anaerolineae bacterium]|nr:arginine--tRNA ligase [Anaerolineae bacterium]MDW8101383.1 arginine--tRNA ligase [Anaerolineae bacterium]
MVKRQLEILLLNAIAKACGEEGWPFAPEEISGSLVERPREPQWGDYSSPVPLQLASRFKRAPRLIAQAIVARLPETDILEKVSVEGPGYINFVLASSWLAKQVNEILKQGEEYGNVNLGQGRKVQVEFVSANPTGPLTVGSGRNAVIGDVLANVLAAAGYRVQREYYINDAGTQMRLFAETLYARYAQALGVDEPIPEEGYRGSYMIELGREIASEEGDRFLHLPRQEAVEAIGEIGLKKMLARIKADLEFIGVYHDNWFSERSLYREGLFEKVMAILREKGFIAEREGAIWFVSSELGEDKDNVLIRRTGEPTYFASDIAYHYDKFFRREFDWVIDVWGADHQGHVPRMKAMMKALGLDPERLSIVLYQMVTLKRGGKEVRISKRTGEIVTLRELAEEVGPDAVRFFLLARAPSSHMDFDIDLAVQQSSENPVYYVQYAYARICSIFRNAGDLDYSDGDVRLLTHPRELDLIRQLIRLPEVIELVASQLASHYLAFYSQELASSFHLFYRDCRVLSANPDDLELTKARLKLVKATQIILGKTLRLMGVSAPERM